VRPPPNDRTRDTNRERRRLKTERTSARREANDAGSKLALLAQSTLSHYIEPAERAFLLLPQLPLSFLFFNFFLSFTPFSHFVSLFFIFFYFLSF
jgi:hypothetical protein